MTNNHCPEFPARLLNSRANEVAIRDFAESIIERINDFTSDFAQDNGIRIDSRILDDWMECGRCEAMVCDVAEHATDKAIKEIMAILNANL